MERDFMGLNYKDPVILIKEEPAKPFKHSGVPWPPASIMSVRDGRDEKPKVLSDYIASSGSMLVPSAEGLGPNHEHQSGELQNFTGATIAKQFIGGNHVTAPPVHPGGSSFGATHPWFDSKAPAQLTIFYGGTVNVYDDISSEKAEEIMLLAGNGFPISNMSHQNFQVATPKLSAGGDDTLLNHTTNSQPNCGLSSPICVSSRPVGPPGDASLKNDREEPNTKCISTSPVSKAEPPNSATSLGPVGASTVIPAAFPQSRKASLARFLRSRKERAMNSAPYSLSKKSAE